MQTVEQVLTAATDSVTLINSVNAGTWNVEGMSNQTSTRWYSVTLTT
jgi:hypothetical protein